jgi:hypothetical protein
MSDTATAQLPSAYIRDSSPDDGGVGVDREAILHHRRKAAMVSLLSEFERHIERHVAPGNSKAIADFKRSCREKLNGITFLACELMKLQPGEEINQHIVDLAEKLQFDANGGQTRP